jgi:hypothetical protein
MHIIRINKRYMYEIHAAGLRISKVLHMNKVICTNYSDRPGRSAKRLGLPDYGNNIRSESIRKRSAHAHDCGIATSVCKSIQQESYIVWHQ